MIKLIKAREEIKNVIDFERVSEVYELLLDEIPIGYGTINKSETSEISIYISKKHRGNGYGKILFKELKKEVALLGYEKLIVTFHKNNMNMRKIIEDNNGIEISKDREIIKYIIPIT